ncbi:hypothetical protein ACP6PL_14510 [Dapis sp. BLCC M126]|uniref:hypothetical protein n=1 Tax=Dapis sp. BLCC M126 TaxID=3400189 RepID=UPI003CEE10BC
MRGSFYYVKNKNTTLRCISKALSKLTYQQVVSELSALLWLAIALDKRQKGAIASITCWLNKNKKEFYIWLLYRTTTYLPIVMGDDI